MSNARKRSSRRRMENRRRMVSGQQPGYIRVFTEEMMAAGQEAAFVPNRARKRLNVAAKRLQPGKDVVAEARNKRKKNQKASRRELRAMRKATIKAMARANG